MIVTFFRGAHDATPSPIETTWPDFANLLRSWSEERAEQDCLPCAGKECTAKLAGMSFSPVRYADGATRGKASVLDVHAFAGDLDHLTREQVAAAREALSGLAHALYSTHNHLRGGEDDWCLRVVIPLSRPVPASDWRRFWLAFAELSGLPLDKVVKSTASLLFMPSRPRGAAHVMGIAEGDPLDVDAVLEHAAPTESVPVPSPREDALRDLGGIAPTEIDADARKTLISLGKLARTLAPGGAYGPQGVGRRMTLYNIGRLIGGLAAAGRVHLDEALDLVERLCDPPLTPGGACEKALRDGALVGEEAPLEADPGPGIVAEARGRPSPEVRYQLEPWTWSQLEAVCRGAPDDAVPIRPRSREIGTMPPPGLGEDDPRSDVEKAAHARALMVAKLRTNSKGQVINCGYNVNLLIEHYFPGKFRFNTLTKSIDASTCVIPTIAGASVDTLPNEMANYLTGDLNDDEIDIVTESDKVAGELLTIARRYEFNPLREQLVSLVWDGTPRLDTWLEVYAGVTTVDDEGNDVTEYVRMVGARWLIGAVARALYPGCKMDTVLTLEGPQGYKKSRIVAIIGGPFFSDTPVIIGTKDGNIAAGSAWILELGELASLKKTESEAQKTFLTSQVDKIRLPYGRGQQEFPRACVFAGTTNADDYLVDHTGNRRFWCVRVVNRCDDTALRIDRDQLLAEAVHRLHHASRPDLCRGALQEQGCGERWWLEPHEQVAADAITRRRMGSDVAESFQEKVSVWLAKSSTAGGPSDVIREKGATLCEVATALDVPAERQHVRLKADVRRALEALGFVKCPGDKRPRRYKLP